MRSSLIIAAAGSAALLAVAAATGPAALAGELYHLRGKLAAASGSDLTIQTDRGTVSVMLAEDAGVFIVEGADIADIKAGQFVGITSIMAAGKRVGLEVHIFEESLRGLGEGHYPWDLVAEENMMTNANVGRLLREADGRTLTDTYMEGEEPNRTEGTQTILVPPEATVVHFYAAGRDKLIVGETVFLIALDSGDGAVTSPAIVVGQNGLEPPM
jgi:hypothetical protein